MWEAQKEDERERQEKSKWIEGQREKDQKQEMWKQFVEIWGNQVQSS